MRHRDLLRNSFGIHITHFQEMIQSFFIPLYLTGSEDNSVSGVTRFRARVL